MVWINLYELLIDSEGLENLLVKLLRSVFLAKDCSPGCLGLEWTILILFTVAYRIAQFVVSWRWHLYFHCCWFESILCSRECIPFVNSQSALQRDPYLVHCRYLTQMTLLCLTVHVTVGCWEFRVSSTRGGHGYATLSEWIWQLES